MILEELNEILAKLDLPIAYSHFKNTQEPPYICYLVNNNDNFMADNQVYKKINNINIELYTKIKDIELEEKIENILDSNKIPYKSDETYIESENVFEKIYMIGVI